MSCDFDEFVTLLGRDVPTYRSCKECGDITIVNADTYDKPKTVCDPGYCEHTVPFCICKDMMIFSERGLASCQYPDCPRVAEVSSDDDDDDF